jgi:hypothetical protein
MVNPDLYEYFVVSEEPLNDRESRISNIIAGGTRVDIVPNDTVVGVGDLSHTSILYYGLLPKLFLYKRILISLSQSLFVMNKFSKHCLLLLFTLLV